jgi:hypothetical protein
MPDITLAEKSKRNLLIGKSWGYLCDNFHKFTEDNRIRIALEVCKKNMPTILEGELNQKITQMGMIEKDGKPLEHKLGA